MLYKSHKHWCYTQYQADKPTVNNSCYHHCDCHSRSHNCQSNILTTRFLTLPVVSHTKCGQQASCHHQLSLGIATMIPVLFVLPFNQNPTETLCVINVHCLLKAYLIVTTMTSISQLIIPYQALQWINPTNDTTPIILLS